MSDAIHTAVERYYSGRFSEHGPTARGVDWNSEESQELRFDRLLEVVKGGPEHFTLLDYGCGYGALLGFLRAGGLDADYRGFDLSESMLAHARDTFGDERAAFFGREEDLEPADYTVASGIFNVKLDVDDETWKEYVLETVASIARLSTRGFAFNMLTSYSDADRMRPDLFYGDPAFYFDHVKRGYARNVALLHDYGLYEFTIVARLDG